jgi:tetratricopeptide (TPR) repeat protein
MQMKKTILFCVAWALLHAAVDAGVQEDFVAANRKYEEGRYAEALALYLELGKQVNDWQVPYNIGNCYYKMERYLSAKVYYLKARKLRPLEGSITRNITMTNRHFRDDATLPDPDFITRTVQLLESKLSMNALSILLLLAVLLLNVFLFLLLMRGKSKKLMYALAFSLLLTLVAGAYHLSRTAASGRHNAAVVWQEESQLLSGPGEDNTVLFKVNPGLEVRIIDHFRDWVQVTASERIAGWIEKKRLVLI